MIIAVTTVLGQVFEISDVYIIQMVQDLQNDETRARFSEFFGFNGQREVC